MTICGSMYCYMACIEAKQSRTRSIASGEERAPFVRLIARSAASSASSSSVPTSPACSCTTVSVPAVTAAAAATTRRPCTRTIAVATAGVVGFSRLVRSGSVRMRRARRVFERGYRVRSRGRCLLSPAKRALPGCVGAACRRGRCSTGRGLGRQRRASRSAGDLVVAARIDVAVQILIQVQVGHRRKLLVSVL